MSRMRLLAGVASAAIAAGIGLGPGGPSPVASASVPSAVSKPLPPSSRPGAGHRARATRFVLISCANRPVVRPKTFDLSCGDDADTLIRLHWRAWRRGRAVARGIQRVNSCTPDCAHGTYARYRVTVILSGTARVAGHPRERRYTEITLRYHGKRPAGVGRQVSGSLLP